ncbi:unnamed protein product, partial [Prorocentrum cordatum]
MRGALAAGSLGRLLARPGDGPLTSVAACLGGAAAAEMLPAAAACRRLAAACALELQRRAAASGALSLREARAQLAQLEDAAAGGEAPAPGTAAAAGEDLQEEHLGRLLGEGAATAPRERLQEQLEEVGGQLRRGALRLRLARQWGDYLDA